jgi:hypothetical protein
MMLEDNLRGIVSVSAGVVMVAPAEVARNAQRWLKAKAVSDAMGESSAASAEKGRALTQTKKERNPSQTSCATVGRLRRRCICRMARFWSARWPLLRVRPTQVRPGTPVEERPQGIMRQNSR